VLLPSWLVTSGPWWLLKVAWTDIAVCYMSMAFVILDGRLALEMHRDVAFLPHIVMFVLCALGLLLPARSSKGGRSKSGAAKGAAPAAGQKQE
jgi:hypothetical protein